MRISFFFHEYCEKDERGGMDCEKSDVKGVNDVATLEADSCETNIGDVVYMCVGVRGVGRG